MDCQTLLQHRCCFVTGVSAVDRHITARAVQAKLSLSKTIYDFGLQIVLRSHHLKPPYTMDCVLINNEATDLEWHMGLPSIEGQEGFGGVFSVEPTTGTIAKVSCCTRETSTACDFTNIVLLAQATLPWPVTSTGTDAATALEAEV